VCLNEHQVGFHPTQIGFPNLGDCMAVVLQTQSGLYGFHFTPGNIAQIRTFRDFINNQSQGGVGTTASHLYGSCRRGRRWAGSPDTKAQWQAQMREIADALGYRGKISGYDLSAASHGPSDADANEGVYLEYVRNSGGAGCDIRYKRMSKMTLTKAQSGATGGDLGIARVTPIGAWGTGGYRLSNPTGMLTADAGLNREKTSSAGGKMHSPKNASIDSFTYEPGNPT
jgi:hypothetical protein